MLQKPIVTKLSQATVFILLVVAMLAFNVRYSQFWNEDSARYVQQANNLANGRAFDASTFKYSPGPGAITPQVPVGFSLLLVPVIKIAGLNMLAFSIYLSLLYVGWMLVSFVFFRKQFGLNTSLVILFVSFFSNFLLWFKLQTLPDVPFSILFLSICLLLSNSTATRKTFLIAGVLTGLSTLFGYAGFVLLPVVWIYFGIQAFRTKNSQPVINSGLFTIVALAIYVLFSWVIFKSHGAPDFGFGAYFSENIRTLGNGYISLFGTSDQDLVMFSIIFGAIILALTFIGLLIKLFTKKPDLFDLALLAYLIFILCGKEVDDYRSLLPVHVILVSYLFYFLRFAGEKITFTRILYLQLGFFAFVFFVYVEHLNYIWRTAKDVLPGPYEPIAQQTFSYIKSNVPGNAVIAFNRPITLGLFADKATVVNNPTQNTEADYNRLKAMGTHYYLYSWNLTDNNYGNFVKLNLSRLKPVYKNWQYTLYQDTTVIKP